MLQKKKEKKYNPNWPQIPNHPYRILTIEGSGSGKLNIDNQILIKVVYILKNHMNQNINF